MTSDSTESTSLSDEDFYSQALEGGASRQVTTGNVPDRGFMVGGASNDQGERFPEQAVPSDKFDIDTVRHHARAIREHFGEEGSARIHQGAWKEDDNVVLDASEQMSAVSTALVAAKLRGERAVYDVRRGRDVKTLNQGDDGPDLLRKHAPRG